jgi:hypothetical protein
MAGLKKTTNFPITSMVGPDWQATTSNERSVLWHDTAAGTNTFIETDGFTEQ